MLTLKKARARMPLYLVGCPYADSAATIQELADAARTELDVILEGQDGTEGASPGDVSALKAYIRYLSRTHG